MTTCMGFVIFLYALYRLVYPLVALGVFVVLIWSKRHDSEHVRRMADAYAPVAWAREYRWGRGP